MIMKNFLIVLLFLVSFSSFSQGLFEHEFDKNLTLNVPEESEEGESGEIYFIRGKVENGIVVVSRTSKGSSKLSGSDEKALSLLYNGVRDGVIKSTKGTLLEEKYIEIHEIKIFNFKVSAKVGEETKIIENYVFHFDKLTYSIQFLSSEKGSDAFENVKRDIIASIKIKH